VLLHLFKCLKITSASSIYGSRAANGVIIVTTKNAAKRDVTVSLVQMFLFFLRKKQRIQMLNALDRGKVLWQASVNDGPSPPVDMEIYNFDWNNDFNNPVLNSVSVKPFVGGDTNVPVGDTDWQILYIKQDYL
jgi:TonB-dependent SusC/RagA subfamily outer membrane receptor